MKNKIIKNIFHIFSGTFIGSLIGMFNTALLVKSIGLEQNGIIFMGLGYSSFFNALFNFQSYDAIIKFLPRNMTQDNTKGKNYIQLAILLDLITAILAFIIAFLMIDYVGDYLKWDRKMIFYTKIIIFTILFTLNGAFTGILRIYEKFKYISYINVFNTLINTIIYGIGYYKKFELSYYVYGTVFSSFINLLIILIFTYSTLKENLMHKLNFFKTKYDKEFIKFTFYTNLSSTLDLPIFHITPFIINKYLGFSDIAIYKILEKIGSLITRVTEVISQVLIPEISKRLSINDKRGAYRIGFRLGKLILGIGSLGLIIIIITKKYWLGYFIPDYTKYLGIIYLYLVYIIFTQSFAAQHPIFIYSGYIKENTIILFIINIFYIFLLIILIKNIGLEGLILARISQSALVFLLKAIILKIDFKFSNIRKKFYIKER